MKKRVDPSVYTKEYYLNSCLGYEQFRKNPGKTIPIRSENILKKANLKKGMNVLDIGCGRGDVCFYLSRNKIKCIGIDYSKDAIELARKTLSIQSDSIKKKCSFDIMDAKNLKFKDNHFDAVICFDLFEHLYKDELQKVLKEIKRVLKKNGYLIVHAEPNIIYLEFTHRYYVYPVSSFIIRLYKLITGKEYPGMPKDPRNDLHKIQHVNEPNYFYLLNLFRVNGFDGKITQIIPFKPLYSWKDLVYNIIVWLFPLSLVVPFIYFFSYDYECLLRNRK